MHPWTDRVISTYACIYTIKTLSYTFPIGLLTPDFRMALGITATAVRQTTGLARRAQQGHPRIVASIPPTAIPRFHSHSQAAQHEVEVTWFLWLTSIPSPPTRRFQDQNVDIVPEACLTTSLPTHRAIMRTGKAASASIFSGSLR
ncbi:hypothetical protein QC764_601996 [Podospora pseudoanserina]|uniref:Uncharacterized protein n=1 Tax=Podospora pseudoanserina TaxID=2609844 RepID=A0ABR0HTM1_9PEZI|nr:hypothetical protein QC764_601996 [Podospora pseudoanserina]